MSAAKLKMIAKSLREMEISREEHDQPGGEGALERRLPPSLKRWERRTTAFLNMSAELNNVSRNGSAAVVVSATELHERAWKAEHILNVVLDDVETPISARRAAINYIGVDEDLIASPLIQEKLVHLAMHHPDPELRRTAWLHLCRHHSQMPLLSGSRNGDGNFGRERMRSLFKEFISQRSPLGPRGTLLQSAEVNREHEGLVSELLGALSRAEGDRKEIALTLSEIGGEEAALRLTDALRSEIEEHSDDEDYQVYLTSSLSNLGGSAATEELIRTLESGSGRVRLAALSGLESLATAGSIALTEYPEPATIESAEMRDAYLKLAERLHGVIGTSTVPPFVRHKADELLDTIRISLNSFEHRSNILGGDPSKDQYSTLA